MCIKLSHQRQLCQVSTSENSPQKVSRQIEIIWGTRTDPRNPAVATIGSRNNQNGSKRPPTICKIMSEMLAVDHLVSATPGVRLARGAQYPVLQAPPFFPTCMGLSCVLISVDVWVWSWHVKNQMSWLILNFLSISRSEKQQVAAWTGGVRLQRARRPVSLGPKLGCRRSGPNSFF